MLYQETYQAGGDLAKLNISSVIYTQNLSNTPPHDSTCNKQLSFPAHTHSFYELDYTIAGTARTGISGRSVTVGPGALTFLPPLAIHGDGEDLRPGHLLLQFSPRLLRNIFTGGPDSLGLIPDGKLQADGFLQIRPKSPADTLIRELIACSPRYRLSTSDTDRILSGYLALDELRLTAALTGLLSVLMQEKQIRLADSHVAAASVSKIHSVLNRLISAPEEMLSMKDAALLVNMSYSNFCRAFKAAIGMSYVDFCNSVRVGRAQELLRHSNLSVTEISTRLNFGSISYFNRIFKKHAGCTPLSYRTSL